MSHFSLKHTENSWNFKPNFSVLNIVPIFILTEKQLFKTCSTNNWTEICIFSFWIASLFNYVSKTYRNSINFRIFSEFLQGSAPQRVITFPISAFFKKSSKLLGILFSIFFIFNLIFYFSQYLRKCKSSILLCYSNIFQIFSWELLKSFI